MTFQPRRWQVEARDAVRAWSDPNRGALIVAATGAGKTKFGHYLADDYLAAGERVLWLAHTKELVEQPYGALQEYWPHYNGGIVKNVEDDAGAQIVYASKDTLRIQRRLDRYLAHGRPALVIVDEAHHSAAPTWRKLIAALHGARFVGLTATPDRNDTSRLSDLWEVVYTYSILDGIADGVLVQPYVAHDILPGLDLEALEESKGDYDIESTARELLTKKIVEHTVRSMQRDHRGVRIPFRDDARTFEDNGSSALVFTMTVEQAQGTARALVEAGIRARAIWGDMPKDERGMHLVAFQEGRLDALVSPRALTEGTDLPRAKRVYIARPTKSWALYVQMFGRGLRAHAGVDAALLVDLVGCSKMHSIVAAPALVDGTDCEEALDGRHRFLAIVGTGEGRCHLCGVVIKCFANLGGHIFKDGHCRKCGVEQCPDSPTKQHSWFPLERGLQECLHCGAEIPDPLTAMVSKASYRREPVMWKDLYLPRASRRVRGVNLGASGMIFEVTLEDGLRKPYLFARGQLLPLARRPVPELYSRMLTDDVARRASKTAGYFGGAPSGSKLKAAVLAAEQVALKFRVWEDK